MAEILNFKNEWNLKVKFKVFQYIVKCLQKLLKLGSFLDVAVIFYIYVNISII
jgi:hypothetical protein